MNTFTIDALASDGRGIARGSGTKKVTFVRGALPGETVEARITAERGTYCEAEATRLLEPSACTVPPPCPHAGQCGGCPLIRLAYPAQLEWKQRLVRDAFTRVGRIEFPDAAPVTASSLELGYRNRVELAFGQDSSGNVLLGMRKSTSHEVIPVPGCRILPDRALPVMDTLDSLFSRAGLSVYRFRRTGRKGTGEGLLRFCQIREGLVPDRNCLEDAGQVPTQRALWIVLTTSPAKAAEQEALRALAGEILAACSSVHAVIHEERTRHDLLTLGERRVFALGRNDAKSDPCVMAMPVLGHSYLVDVADFFQVNTSAADLLVNEVAAATEDGLLADLYCGSGAPGLSTRASFVRGLEYSPSAIAMARRNACRFGRRGRYEAADAGKALAGRAWRNLHARQVLLDPPRGGLAPQTATWLKETAPDKILYISCNPVTLARDVALLHPMYRISALRLADYFPQTPHVETFVLLERH